MPTKRDNKKTIADAYLDRVETIAEKFVSKPIEYPTYTQPEPIKFSNDPGTVNLGQFIDEIMQVLDGHTLEEIRFASAIVEQYVSAQSKGQMISINPAYYRP